jgi:DNA-directed RNA polymerase subunit RPC12/RpoP
MIYICRKCGWRYNDEIAAHYKDKDGDIMPKCPHCFSKEFNLSWDGAKEIKSE